MAQPKLALANVKELLTLGPILGLDATTDPYYVDGTLATDLLNVVPNRIYKAYSTIRGRIINPLQVGSGTAAPTALGIFYIPGQTQPYVMAVIPTDAGFRFSLGGIGAWFEANALASLGSAPGSFEAYLSWDFYSEPAAAQSQSAGTAAQFKILNTNFPFSVNVTKWQAYPPTTAPGVPSLASAAGYQNGIWGAGYYWRYTYSNAVLETSPSPPIGPINLTGIPPPTTNTTAGPVIAPPAAPALSLAGGGTLPARTEYFQITYVSATAETTPSAEVSINVPANEVAVLTSPPAVAGAVGYIVYGSNISGEEFRQPIGVIAIGTNFTEPNGGLTTGTSASFSVTPSTDPQITTINLYRIGGSLAQWLLVASTNNTSSIVDTLPDALVTGQALVLHRDPPAPFGAIAQHKERMFGFGYPAYTDWTGTPQPAATSDLWYSNYVQPWGFDNTNQVIQIGAHSAGDVGVEIKSLSSMLVMLKAKTIWALYGESPVDFFPQKLFDVGCASKRSVVLAFGVIFWLSNQGVYMFDGSNLTYISTDIKKILDSFSAADFAASAGCFDDRMYWLSFPTQGISLGYDTVGGKWWKTNMSDTIFAYDYEGNSRGGGATGTAIDYVFGGLVQNNIPLVEQWFAAETDRGGPISSLMQSKIGSSDGIEGTLQARWVELSAYSLSPTDLVLVTVNPNPGFVPPPAVTQVFNAANIPRQLISLPPGVIGQEMQLTIAATTSDMLQLEGAAIHGWVRRVLNAFG